jgi:hypothetical protein
MSNVNALNTFLRSVETPSELVAEYRKRCPLVFEVQGKGDAERDALNYCSGAAQFVMQFLTNANALYPRLQTPGLARKLDSTTASSLLSRVSGSGATRIGYLISDGQGAEGHECVFAGSGNQWAFYQANVNGTPDQRFTLAPKLNPMQRNWNVFDMGDRQFAEFFVGLTNPGYSAKLFRTPITRWTLAAVTANGQNLFLANR